ncbi:MAG TPA: LptE family protein [Acidobacteriota bacterium]|nr:LptE family protein [Acidobacteriota bacterium]
MNQPISSKLHYISRVFHSVCVFVLVFVTVGAGPCGYKPAGKGGSLPPNIRTIAIQTFTNESLRYRVEQRFTAALADEILRRGLPIKLTTDTTHADALITGSIRNFGFRGVLVDDQGRIRLYELTITSAVTLRDQTSNRILFNDQRLQFRGEYQLSDDPRSFFNEEDPAVERMARDFARSVVTSMLEGF